MSRWGSISTKINSSLSFKARRSLHAALTPHDSAGLSPSEAGLQGLWGRQLKCSISNLNFKARSSNPTGTIPPCSTRISKVGKCAAFQLWTPTYVIICGYLPFNFWWCFLQEKTQKMTMRWSINKQLLPELQDTSLFFLPSSPFDGLVFQ